MLEEIILDKKEPPKEIPSGICVQYAEGFQEITEEAVKKILKKIRKGAYKHVLLTLDPDGESTLFELENINGYLFLSIGEEVCQDNAVTWTYYLSYNKRFADSDEEVPGRSRYGRDYLFKRYAIENLNLASQCAEWFIRTGKPYPGIDWAKQV